MRKWSLKSCKSFQQGTGTESEVRFECAQEVRKAKKPKNPIATPLTSNWINQKHPKSIRTIKHGNECFL